MEEIGELMDIRDLLHQIMEGFASIERIHASDIPNIDLYMDQVTTFMDKNLRKLARHPDEDKVMTKTMINNYAKNDLLPPPIKKKYSREHVLVLIFIYYYKGIMSISDIQTLLGPITKKYFKKGNGIDIEAIYEEVFSMTAEETERLKKDVVEKYDSAMRTFEGASDEDAEFLKLFAFVCALSFDVYMKRIIIEKLIDSMRDKKPESGNLKKKGEEK